MQNIWQGERIRLRAVEPDDWAIHFAWDQNTQTARETHEIPFPNSTERAKQWAREESLRGAQNDAFRFQIEALETGELAGTINTHSCNLRNGTFSYGLAVRDAYRRRGYASEAIMLVLRYFFFERRYQKAWAVVYSFNTASLRLHEKLGFTEEGRLTRMIYSDGAHHDYVYYGLTIEAFRAREPV